MQHASPLTMKRARRAFKVCRAASSMTMGFKEFARKTIKPQDAASPKLVAILRVTR
jgi:hypothetical protein